MFCKSVSECCYNQLSTGLHVQVWNVYPQLIIHTIAVLGVKTTQHSTIVTMFLGF